MGASKHRQCVFWVTAGMALSCSSAKDGPAATHAAGGANVTGPT